MTDQMNAPTPIRGGGAFIVLISMETSEWNSTVKWSPKTDTKIQRKKASLCWRIRSARLSDMHSRRRGRPGTKALAESVLEPLKISDVALMQAHGVERYQGLQSRF